jgi:hypothetical protein
MKDTTRDVDVHVDEENYKIIVTNRVMEHYDLHTYEGLIENLKVMKHTQEINVSRAEETLKILEGLKDKVEKLKEKEKNDTMVTEDSDK